ncbi:hypothetical protein E3N88_39442 [Mikania micrantha]|uniref:Leucine-rich repeat-containing N-terminal plant-type domain-containing protein n=1 Tax=Mikania micrantha TaxID=192012 RepID=A0A5N6LXN2_9ASTR|nr:hypothetical protein E3N88_39442 [Mikania micrantha]
MVPPKPLLFPTTKHHLLKFDGLLIMLLLLFPAFVDADCNTDDKDSLLSFATNFPTLNWSAMVDCCSWDGISCDKHDRVVRLSIPKRRLRGTLPSSLQNLTNLSFLNLSNNFLSGLLPDGFFSSFNNLHTIDLSDNYVHGNLSNILPATIKEINFSSNSFFGTIPPSICINSPALVILDLSLNYFTGNIPQGFGTCSNLQVLSLGFNNLTGKIPTDINGVRSLQHLSLPGNSLTNEIGEKITSLTNLRSLVLFGNMFSGSIPLNIGKLSLLEKLELHINRLNGTLPLSLMNCTKLKILNLRVNSLGGRLSDFDFSNFTQLAIVDMGENQFGGVLPKSLFLCRSLTAIRLSTNKLEGEILPDILELPSLSFLSLSNNTFKNIIQALDILSSHEKLTTLILSKNFFNETLPAAGISGFQDLKILALGGCKLFGHIPIWLMSLTNVQVVDLSVNNINGIIPGWLQTLPNLFCLDLSNNSLSGSFPVELTRLPALASQHVLDHVNINYLELPVFVAPENASYLQYNQLVGFPPSLYLASNNLRGGIPVEIGNMQLIHVLDLSQNYFSGTIPGSISNLTNLEMLDLSRNLLSGEIPSSLKGLHFLSSFNVAFNNLLGAIPTGGQFDTFLNQSYEGNPGLCGPPMQRSCSKRSDPPPPVSEHKKGPDIIMILGPFLGFCFGFGIILTCQAFLILSERRIFPKWIHRYVIWT